MQIGVVDLWTATHVTRISDTVVTISIPSSFLYAIDADDALQLSSIGSSALASGVALSGLDEMMPVTDENRDDDVPDRVTRQSDGRDTKSRAYWDTGQVCGLIRHSARTGRTK